MTLRGHQGVDSDPSSQPLSFKPVRNGVHMHASHGLTASFVLFWPAIPADTDSEKPAGTGAGPTLFILHSAAKCKKQREPVGQTEAAKFQVGWWSNLQDAEDYKEPTKHQNPVTTASLQLASGTPPAGALMVGANPIFFARCSARKNGTL